MISLLASSQALASNTEDRSSLIELPSTGIEKELIPYCEPQIVRECINAIETWKAQAEIERYGRLRAETLMNAAVLTATTSAASRERLSSASSSAGYSLGTVVTASAITLAVGILAGMAISVSF